LTTTKKKQFKQYIKIGIFLNFKEPLIIWLYNILTMNLPNACYYRYVASSNYSDFLKRHLHLRNRLLDQGYQKNYFIRTLKKFIFRYQDEIEKDPDFNVLLKLFFLCCCQFVTAKQTACGKAFSFICGRQYQRCIYDVLWEATNDMDFLKRHLHLRNRLLDQGYQKNYFIRSLKKFIFRYQDLVEIYS
jgi:DNA polymerase III delta prime subunit